MKKVSLSLLLTLVITLALSGCGGAKSEGGFNYNDAKSKVFSLNQDGDYTRFTYEITISKDVSNFDKLSELMYSGKFNGVEINNTNMPRFHGNDSLLGYGVLSGNLSDVSELVLTCPDGRELKAKTLSNDLNYKKYNILETSMGNYGFHGWEVKNVESYTATLRCLCSEFGGNGSLPLEYISSTLKVFDENGDELKIEDIGYEPYTQTSIIIKVLCHYNDTSSARMYFKDWKVTVLDEDDNEFYIKGEN